MDTIDVTEILKLIITVIVAPLIPILAMQLKTWMNTSIDRQRMAMMMDIVQAAVLAAEQLKLNGDEAKQHAIKFTESILKAQGLTADLDLISNMIEAAVMKEFNTLRSITASGDNRKRVSA